MRIQFAAQHYDTLLPERLINCYPEPAPPSTGFKFALPKIDGLSNVYEHTLTGRGLYYVPGAAGDKLLGVWGGNLYAFTSAYSASLLSTTLTAGADRAVMFANEDDVAILSGGDLFVYDVSVPSITQVTDADLVTLADIGYLNDYLIGVESGSGRLVFALTDWTSWDALDFTTAEEAPDKLVRVLVWKEQALAFGRRTIEFFAPTGDADAPFQAIGALAIPKGACARDAILLADNTPFWIGDDRLVYRLIGTPARISNNEIETAILALTDAEAATIEANTWVERGHTFVGFDIPGYGTAVYDCQSGVQTPLWHKRETYGETYWRPRAIIQAFGKNVAQARTTDTLLDGGLFEMSRAVIADGDLPLIREWTASMPVESGRPPVSDYTVRGTMGVGLDGEGQGTDPQIMIDWSDQRGNAWSNEVWRSLGRIGEYDTIATVRRMGRARAPGRTIRHRVSDPVDFTPYGADVNVGQP